ncbi:MAG: carbohydrate ABC transporter substrate-binding protein, partial [Proteobacteria bacterium]|nr:carbohydrate ABC transporter substrate-binding protein [Pseudomonadota bacterium]
MLLSQAVFASTLVINSNQSDPVPKATFTEIVNRFRKENPGIKVEYNEYDHEAYKTALRNWLSTSP